MGKSSKIKKIINKSDSNDQSSKNPADLKTTFVTNLLRDPISLKEIDALYFKDMAVNIENNDQLKRELSAYFGLSFQKIYDYAKLLEANCAQFGLLGPNEKPKIWERHIANSASLINQFTISYYTGVFQRGFTGKINALNFEPPSSFVADIGSGAGLPGIVLAIMLENIPDYKNYTVDLIEPMGKRAEWLNYVVHELDLKNVRVFNNRIQDFPPQPGYNVVISRAVAKLDELINMSAPIMHSKGTMMFLKGDSVESEIELAKPQIDYFKLIDVRVAESQVASTFEKSKVFLAEMP
ncbi:MAG: 16S rRNA (guanine(527)-N(7))-methyltransferase RsmG [Bifidobacteriaceae bacterium]|jgi:16S rRNA (guanine527-N7)-methyltransferase|nr:16S rRNA (guanine(527)-N(7))-methyltransferase RsmG [Bifidobacteriaceae bacterium]